MEQDLRRPEIGGGARATAATITADRHRLRMLAVLASPVAGADGGRPKGPPLDVWGEWERLRLAIGVRDAVEGGGAPWAVARLTPATAESLADTLAASQAGFQAVHFGCHGGPQGLHIEDDLGRERELPTPKLVKAVRGRGVDLIVLNACETTEVAQALVEQAGVRAVIATRKPIYDGEARVLAERLYRGLALGRPVGEALTAARETISERHLQGDLGLSHCSTDVATLRADNLFLVGDSTLTLSVEEPAAETPLFVLDPTPRNDPLRLDLVSDFVGRYDELLRLARWFAETGRLAFAISGVGGVGKTALALNAALRAAHRFEALAVASARDTPDLSPARVLEAIAAAQNAAPSTHETSSPAAAVARRMNASRILLVLDNLETVRPDIRTQLARILAGIRPESGSRVLLTMRPQEQYSVTDLVAGTDRLTLTTLDRPNALRKAWNKAQWHGLLIAPPPPPPRPPTSAELKTLARTASDAWLQHEGDESNMPWLLALDDIAGRAFRHPKMIELAFSLVAKQGWHAARVRLTQLAGREITLAFEDLIGTLVDNVAETDPQALDVLHAVLVFRGGATTPLLRFVVLGREVAEGSLEAIEFEDGPLAAAVRASVLSRTEMDLQCVGRFDLDPPMRAYLERFRQVPQARLETLRMRHAKALVSVLGKVVSDLKNFSLAAIPEWSNLISAWEWLSAAPEGERGELLLAHAGRWSHLVSVGKPMIRDWLEAALIAARKQGSQRDEAEALYALATASGFAGDFDTALEQYEASLTLFHACEWAAGEARSHYGLAALGLIKNGFLHKAIEHGRLALGLYRSLNEVDGEANSLSTLGRLLRLTNDLDASLQLQQESLQLSRKNGYRLGEANALIGIGVIELLRGEQRAADQRLETAIAIFGETDNLYSIAAQIGNYGWALMNAGKPAAARPYLARAANLFETMGTGFEVYRDRCRSAIEDIDQTKSGVGSTAPS